MSTLNNIWICCIPQLIPFKRATSSLCIQHTPIVDNVCPWPQLKDEDWGRPFKFLVRSSGQNNNCSSEGTCQGSRRSRRNLECSTEASKAAAISCPSHQSQRYDYKREVQTDKGSSLKRSKRSVESTSTSSFLQMAKFYVLCRVLLRYHWVTGLKTELLLWKSFVVFILPDGTQLSNGTRRSRFNWPLPNSETSFLNRLHFDRKQNNSHPRLRHDSFSKVKLFCTFIPV